MKTVQATPWRAFPAALLPDALPVPVQVGATYVLRTDAQTVDEDTGAVTYPLCYVSDGGGGLTDELDRGGMVPFHKLQEVEIQAQGSKILVAADSDCTVWVLQRPPLPQVREPVPGGGASCGCKGKKKKDDDDDDCGCGCGRPKPAARW